jgi:hypothetical protein
MLVSLVIGFVLPMIPIARSVKTRNLLVFGGKKTLPFIHLENVLLISLIAFMD